MVVVLVPERYGQDFDGPGCGSGVDKRTETLRFGLLRSLGLAVTRGLAVALSPVIVWQGVRVRRATPRLPEADGERAGIVGAGSGAPLRLLVLGESTAVGVGVTDQRDGLGFRVAGELARRTQARVEWHVVGRTGATVAQVTSSLLHDLPGDLDLVVVVFGVNDTLRLRSRRAWRRQIGQLLDAVTPSVATTGRIAILGVPHFATLPALPQPLRTILHWHALALDRELHTVIARRRRCVHVPSIPLPVGDFLSHDRFHPNAVAYTVWATHIVDTIS